MLAIIVAYFVVPTAFDIQAEQNRVENAKALPACCLKLNSPLENGCTGDVLAFQCEVDEKISTTKRISIRELYKKINVVEPDADKIRDLCQCPKK